MVVVTREGHIIDIACDSAGEFLEVLNPLSGVFAYGGTEESYIFRGVSSAAFDLIPSAFRQVELLYEGRYRYAPFPHVLQQCAAELETLRRFVEIAARQGVRLPEDSVTLRSALEQWSELLTANGVSRNGPIVWPPTEFLSLIALSQHYQIPTRALDWTFSALTAAYFAASAAVEAPNRRIAVWAFSRVAERFDRFLSRRDVHVDAERPLILYSTAGADNDNLRAQRGLFMIYSHTVTDSHQLFGVPRYDELLLKSLPTITDAAVVYKVTVDARENGIVLAALASSGVTAGALFPGLWGAAREFREQKRIATVSSFLPRTGVAEQVAELLLQWNIPPGG